MGYRYQRAKLLEALGRPDESQAEWKRLAKLRPDDPDFAARSRGETWEPVTLNLQSAPSPTGATASSQEQAVAARHRQNLLKHFQRMDTDTDNRVTVEEYVDLFAQIFPNVDQDKSGTLTAEEFNHPAFRQMDTDGDGQATLAEYQQLYADQHRGLDRNGDGFWTKDEIQ